MARKSNLFDGDDDGAETAGDNKSELQSYIDRLTRLDEQRREISEDITSVINEAKAKGYPVKALRRSFSISKLGREDRQELGAMVEKLGLFD